MPVPIDQTGSYANIILLKFLIPFNPIFHCFFKITIILEKLSSKIVTATKLHLKKVFLGAFC